MAKRKSNSDAQKPVAVNGRSRSRRVLLAGSAVLLVALAVFFIARWRQGSGVSRPDIILVTIDTLRADALGFAGNEKVRTPFLDRIAAEGIVFTNAHAHNVITFPSHANILTGLLPYQHGIRDNAGYTLDPQHRTIASRLREEGYATAAFVAAFPLDSRTGLDQGFDRYDDDYRQGSDPTKFIMVERPAAEVLGPAKEWWGSSSGQKRFLWIHLFEPHSPYVPPPHLAAEYADDPYLGEVTAVDQELEAFLSPILAKEEILLIATSDHGEALGEHGELTHGLFAYEETLKVPLLIHEPRRLEPRSEARAARHIDIVPTILDRLGIEPPGDLPGRSLLGIDGEADTYFEALSASLNRGWAPLTGLIRDNRKYIHLPIPELYDLVSDPAEQRNILDDDRRTALRLREELEAIDQTLPARHAISAEEQAQLLSLGYTAGTASQKTTYTEEDDPKNLVHLDGMLQQAIAHYQAGEVTEGVAKAREILEERPDMQQARDVLAFLLQQSERPEEAIEVIHEAIALGTATAEMRRRLALILSETGRADEAVSLLETLSPEGDPELLNAYGIALADLGRLEEAVMQFRGVLEQDPRNAVAWQNLGITALRAGDAARAMGYLQRALEINDRLPLAWNTLGVVQMRRGDTGAAIAAWQRAIALDEKQYDALFNLSLIAGRAGRWDLAHESLTRFIESAPPERYGSELNAARQMLREVEVRRAAG